MEGSQGQAKGRSLLQGLHYNHHMLSFLHQQLERVKGLEQPSSATSEEWQAFSTRVKKAHRLLAKHSEQFDIRTFYRIEDVRSAVDETCQYLRAQVQEWQLQCAAELEDALPYDYIEEDREYLHKLLSYILKGRESGVNDELLHRWLPMKRAHEAELKFLRIIPQDALVMKKRVGTGGYGLVYEAQWNFSRVAVKTALTDGDLPIEEFASFVKEVLVHAKLSHPHIVQVHATTPSGWLVMEMADTDLGALCRNLRKIGWAGTLNLLQQASEALCFLHSLSPPIVHSDVKSSNFLIFGTDPCNCKVKIADFGLAFEAVKGRSKTTRLGGGTLEWMAPEIYHGQPVSTASDVFGFGVVIYETVTRTHPYGANKLKLDVKREFVANKKLSGEEPCTVQPGDCPKEMRLLMKRCCSTNPAERPTMMEITQYLQNLPTDWTPSHQPLSMGNTAVEIDLSMSQNNTAEPRGAVGSQEAKDEEMRMSHNPGIKRKSIFSQIKKHLASIATSKQHQPSAKIDSSNVQEAERKPPGMLDQMKDQLQVLSLQSLGSKEAPDDAMEAIAEGEGASDLQPASEADTSWAKGLQMSTQESPGQEVYGHGGQASEDPDWRCKYVLEEHEDWVQSLVVTKDWLVSGSDDRKIRVWRLGRWESTQSVLEGHMGSVLSMAANGEYLFSGSYDNTVRVWKLGTTWECVRVLEGHTKLVQALAATRYHLFSGSWDQSIRMWSVGTWRCERVLQGHTNYVSSLAVNDRFLISSSDDHTIRIWRRGDGECQRVLHSGWVLSLAVSGDFLISADTMGVICIWSLATWDCVRQLSGHTGWVRSLAVGGGLLFSGSDDETVRVWRLGTWECIRVLKGHSSSVAAVAVLGERLFSGSMDKTVRVWDRVA